MKEFIKTAIGRRFFSVEVPKIVKQLARIADALESDIVTRKTGRFEEITQTELKKLESDQRNFDEFFELMVKNFDLMSHFPHQLESVKNIVRHTYNATKS